MLDATSYLIDALEEIEKHAKEKLKEAKRLYRMARKAYRTGRGGDSERFWQKAEELESGAKKDLEMIQKALANPDLNK